jgi:dethiobiotin synthetase
MSGFFITGTDTEIGKTFVACAMLIALQQRGLQAAPMKPVAAGTRDENGVATNEDVAALMAVSGHQFALADVNPYCLAEPIAPHIAAAREQVDIDPDTIANAYARLQAQSDVVLVEGAGGFLVPMNDTDTLAEIPTRLALDVVLVVGMRLGCINHALLTAEAIRHRGLRLAGWIANTPGEPMAAFEDNLATLDRMMAAPRLGNVPRLPMSDARSSALAAAHYLDLDALF